jgi:non-lysosomal glucosylceramidase
VTYALVTLLLQERLEEGWRTAWSAYNVTYVTRGFWFRTTQVWDAADRFHASLYLRPLVVWAIEQASALRPAPAAAPAPQVAADRGADRSGAAPQPPA